ncbi:MAG: hypothetical protein HY048_11705 [Acidobacteria bacterium]|nr:hypothetical protein [Acidobacteriota bacterium]
MRRSCLVAVAAVVISAILPVQGFAQSPSLSTATVPESVVMSRTVTPAPDTTFEQGGSGSSSFSPAGGIGVKLGTLGVGIQGAVAVANRVNVRGGFNVFSYSHTFDQSGASIDGSLKLQSVEANLDLLIGGGFRFSPGVLLYNNNHIDGTLSVGSSQFSIGGQTYTSLASDPIRGTTSMTFNKFSPMLAIGFGQLVPRSGRHFSMALDLGVVFEDVPTVGLTYSGTGCLVTTPALPASVACKPINTQPNIVTAIGDEQKKIQDNSFLQLLKYYPVISIGFGWRF